MYFYKGDMAAKAREAIGSQAQAIWRCLREFDIILRMATWEGANTFGTALLFLLVFVAERKHGALEMYVI